MNRLRFILFGPPHSGLAVRFMPWLFGLVGGAFMWLGSSDLTEALRADAVVMSCAEFLQHPDEGPRWVSLTGCRLDLPGAATRRWNGWWPSRDRDAGTRGKTLELFIPLSAIDQPVGADAKVVVATTDRDLLSFIDQIQRLDSAQKVDDFIIEHQAELENALAPEHLTGYVEPVASTASHTALGVMTTRDAVVLEQGREPRRLNSLCTVLFGLAVLGWGLMPVIRRARGLEAHPGAAAS